MGGEYTKEYTVSRVVLSSKYYEVHLFGYGIPLKLEKTHPNFAALFNKLRIGSTHEFTANQWKHTIIDIRDCKVYYTCGVVTGFIDISIAHPKLTDEYQVLIDGFTEHDIIVNIEQKEEIKINETYMFHYSKAFGYNYYKVIKFLPTLK